MLKNGNRDRRNRRNDGGAHRNRICHPRSPACSFSFSRLDYKVDE
jgi:hypothetical protein